MWVLMWWRRNNGQPDNCNIWTRPEYMWQRWFPKGVDRTVRNTTPLHTLTTSPTWCSRYLHLPYTRRRCHVLGHSETGTDHTHRCTSHPGDSIYKLEYIASHTPKFIQVYPAKLTSGSCVFRTKIRTIAGTSRHSNIAYFNWARTTG